MKAFIIVAVAWAMVLLPLAAIHVIGDTMLMAALFYLILFLGAILGD